MEAIRNAINLVSYFIIPLMLVGFPVYGLYKRVPVYESFVGGAKEGFQVAVRIIPYLVAKMASVMFGSTETTFYVIAVYFGAINVKKTRHAVPVGLTADISAMLFAVWSVRLLFG
jgi:spore maturation protein SpmB